MTLTLDLPKELETQLYEVAARNGVPADAWARLAVEASLRRATAPRLLQEEAGLLQRINRGLLTPDEWQEYQALTAKRRAETLSHNEHARLIALSDQLEVANAQRLGYVSQLAHMRHVTLEVLMTQLGLTV